MSYRFTVFTPAYNRAHTLPRVYESLKQQTFRDFEWLIVDDGSTDNTKELVEVWQKENRFPIRYFWQKNAHKKVAFNRGVKEARGELFFCWDSDDAALPEALEIFNQHWRNIPEEERDGFAAVWSLCLDERGNLVGDKFPEDVFDSNTLEIFYRYKVMGEKWGCQRTDVLRQFPFPEDVQGLVTENIVWSAIARNYKTRFINKALRIYYMEQTDSLMRTVAEKNADGHALWTRDVLCNDLQWFFYYPTWFLKMAANYTRYVLHLQKNNVINRWVLHGFFPRLLVVVMYPVGLLVYQLDKRKK
ncbi:MAG: glycosyltransferase family A protein [Methylococcales bacterium]|nr:glycosyltransferase family A protein [Methylococcales bacterium]